MCRFTVVYTALLFMCFSLVAWSNVDDNTGETNTTDVAVTGGVSEIGVSSVSIYGYVNIDQSMLLLLKEFGIEYSLSPDFANSSVAKVNGYSDRKFSVNINGLKPNQKYYYRTYVQSLSGLSFYGHTDTFTTNKVGITVTTSYTRAKITTNDLSYISFSLFYSTHPDRDFIEYRMINDDQGNTINNMVSGEFVRGLKPGTTYYFYLSNSYGSTDVQSFTTKQLPFSLSGISAKYSNKPVYDSYIDEYGHEVDLTWLGSTYTVSINSDCGNQLRYGFLGIKNRDKSKDFDVYKTSSDWLVYSTSTNSPYVIERKVWTEDQTYGDGLDSIKFLLELVKSGNATSDDYSELRMLLDNLNTFTFELQAFVEYDGEQIYLDTPNSESQPSSTSPTSIGLNYTSVNLEVGGTKQLGATVYPSEASQSVEWTSSNTSVATVSSTGLVTAKSVGTAVITAVSSEDSSVKSTCDVSVLSVAPTGISLSTASKSMYAGETMQLYATVYPSEASQSVEWASSNTSVATVSSTGLVTAKSVGTAVITAVSSEDSSVKSTCDVSVLSVAPTGISLNTTSKSMYAGGTMQLYAAVFPNGASQSVSWTSSNSNIVSVDNTGLVIAKSSGNAVITVCSSVDSSVKATCSISVREIDTTGVFTSQSANDVLMTFMITDKSARTCQVGTGTTASISDEFDGKIVVPKTVNGYTVTAIAENAFGGTNIYSVVIPNTIETIGEYAFAGCTWLDDVTSYIEQPFDIPVNAFSGIPKDARLSVLYGYENEYMNKTGWNSFSKIRSEDAIVNGIRYDVEEDTTTGENESYSASIHRSYWNDYEGTVSIPETFEIGGKLFTVTGIDDGAFANSRISSVSIPRTIEFIDDRAFYNCNSLKAFYSAITDINKTRVSSTAFDNLPSDAILYVPIGCKAAYEATNNWKGFKEIVEMEDDTDISQMENVIYTEPTRGIAGTTLDLCMKMKNVLTPVGCSFKLTLPEELRLLTDADGDVVYELGSRAKKMSLTMQDWDDGSFDFALTPSSATATITGNDDTFITFRVVLPDDIKAGDYKLKLTRCLIQSKADGTTKDYALSDVVSTLTVEDYMVGDVNGDKTITPSDAIMTLYHYFNVEQAGFNAKAADMNGDGTVTPADAIEMLYMYFGTGVKAALQKRQRHEPQ